MLMCADPLALWGRPHGGGRSGTARSGKRVAAVAGLLPRLDSRCTARLFPPEFRADKGQASSTNHCGAGRARWNCILLSLMPIRLLEAIHGQREWLEGRVEVP